MSKTTRVTTRVQHDRTQHNTSTAQHKICFELCILPLYSWNLVY